MPVDIPALLIAVASVLALWKKIQESDINLIAEIRELILKSFL